MCESVGKADLLSDHFDSKQSREAVDLSLTCHASSHLTTFAFWSREVRSVRVTRGALVAHRYTYAPPRCRTSQCRRTFIPLSVSLWNDLADSVFDGVGLAGFKSRANVFLLTKAALTLL